MWRSEFLSIYGKKVCIDKEIFVGRLCGFSRSHWSRGLRRGSVTARILGLRVRIPSGAWVSVLNVVCCQVDVSSTGWSLPSVVCVWVWSSTLDNEEALSHVGLLRPGEKNGCKVLMSLILIVIFQAMTLLYGGWLPKCGIKYWLFYREGWGGKSYRNVIFINIYLRSYNRVRDDVCQLWKKRILNYILKQVVYLFCLA